MGVKKKPPIEYSGSLLSTLLIDRGENTKVRPEKGQLRQQQGRENEAGWLTRLRRQGHGKEGGGVSPESAGTKKAGCWGKSNGQGVWGRN